MQKNIIVVLSLVVVGMGILIGILVYFFSSANNSLRICFDAADKLNDRHRECISQKNTINEEKVNGDNENDNQTNVFDANLFNPRVADYNITFKYPRKYIVTGGPYIPLTGFYQSLLIWTNIVDDNSKGFNSSIFKDLDYQKVQSAAILLEITSDIAKYETSYQKESGGKISISGKEYQFTDYYAGDANPSLSVDSRYSVLKLENDLYVVLNLSSISMQSFCVEDNSCQSSFIIKPDGECVDSCDNFEPEKYYELKSSEEDIDNAYKILETLRWEKVK